MRRGKDCKGTLGWTDFAQFVVVLKRYFGTVLRPGVTTRADRRYGSEAVFLVKGEPLCARARVEREEKEKTHMPQMQARPEEGNMQSESVS